MNILQKLFGKSIAYDDIIIILQRNDICYCGSGKKYKKCHEPGLEKNNKIACKIFDKDGNDKGYKIFKKHSKALRNISNLTIEDLKVQD